MIFGNLWGLLALLGVPAILAIHFLQQRSRKLPVTTLFLLEQLSPESVEGRTFHWIRNSAALWLQLLAVLLLTWLLIEPRWLRQESTQTLAVVLDTSASMSAFRNRARDVLRERLPELAKAAAHTDFLVMTSDPSRPALYRGRELLKAVESLGLWVPAQPSHTFGPALQIAEGAVRRAGTVILVTDRLVDTPSSVSVLAVGHPIENVGFTGLEILQSTNGPPRWRALLMNHGLDPASREWKVELPGGETMPPSTAQLGPGEMRAIEGSFPPGRDRFAVKIAGDEFALDDTLYVIRPLRKRLAVFASPGDRLTPILWDKAIASLPDAVRVSDRERADLEMATQVPGQGYPKGLSVVLAYTRTGDDGKYAPEPIVADRHPLIDDLNWQALLSSGPAGLRPAREDVALAWQRNEPLIFFGQTGRDARLVLNFDVVNSNIGRLPAYPVLIHRFAAMVRRHVDAPEASNFDTNQRIDFVKTWDEPVDVTLVQENTEPRQLSDRELDLLRAPELPGFFELRRGTNAVLSGSASFADAREARFGKAESYDGLGRELESVVRRNTLPDPFVRLWMLLLGAALLASWWAQRRVSPA